jgi:polar amino acid transport system permease protein
MDLAFLQRSLPELWDGAIVTAQLATVALLGAGLGGLAVAAARRSRWRTLRLVSGAYVELMRDTPILVQLAVLYFGLPTLGLYPDAFTSAAIALTLQNAAYTGEIYRAGIASIPSGQVEAATALGLRPLAVYGRVVLPQAFRRVLPALGNQAVVIVKDTSIASTVALAELTSTSKLLLDRSAAPYETFLLVALLYLALNSCVLGALKLAAMRFPVRS